MTKSAINLLVGVVVLSSWSGAALAKADTRVVVLGLRAPDGDDAAARALTAELQRAAGQVKDWTVIDSPVSLEQMLLVNGCEEPDRQCLREIANNLGADRIISGEVRRDENRRDYDLTAEVFFFNAQSRRMEKREPVTLNKDDTTRRKLRTHAETYIERFSTKAKTKPVELEAPPTQKETAPDKSGPPLWPAATMLGVSATSLALTAWSWSTIRSVENSATFEEARRQAGAGVSNICTATGSFRTARVDSLCDKASLHEKLQWVFLSTSLVSGGVGAWLLVRHLKGKRTEQAKVEWTPVLGRGHTELRAHFVF